MDAISKNFKNISNSPGVYFFKDKNDNVIYIGKAKNLKKRVSSYFTKSNKDIKNRLMISKAIDVETIVVGNEVEALITESNLIKIHKPRYNVFLKDDKTFPYIIITDETYPRVEIIRKKDLRKDGNMYFGPYTDVNYLRSIVKVLHQIFPLRTCSFLINKKTIKEEKNKVCLDYHIQKCQGPCEGLVSENEYNKMIYQVVSFLKGKNKDVRKHLNTKMQIYSKKFMYEEAARIRDQLRALNAFEKKQTKLTQKFVNRDIMNISHEENYAIALVMRIRNGLLVGREKFNLKMVNNFEIDDELGKFMVQYYKITMDFPDEIIIGSSLKDKINIIKWLKEESARKISILLPLRGEKKRMLDVCIKNNDLVLKDYIFKAIKRNEFVPKTLIQLKDDLNMSVIPKRIEAFDNSNIQGEYSVAGMVCFIDGKPSKKEYRHFNIKSVKGIDDFKSMREVVFRRYSRLLNENKQLPDLILIDGGKGQLSAAKSSLDKLGLGYIAIIGLAKKYEEVFIPTSSEAQNISKTSSSIYLLRKIRDEVHRYSVQYHRVKRSKGMFNSNLTNIKGLGQKRVKLLWNTYESFSEILNDKTENIKNKTKIPIKTIELIKKEIKKYSKENNE